MNNRSQNPQQDQKQAQGQQASTPQNRPGQSNQQNPQQNLGGRGSKDDPQKTPGGNTDAFPGSPPTVYAGKERNEDIETAQGGRSGQQANPQGGRDQNQQGKNQTAPGRSPGDDEEE